MIHHQTAGLFGVVLCLPLLFTVACNRKGDATRTERERDDKLEHTSGGPTVGADQAIHSISRARCDREQRCGNIGPDNKKWSTMDDCRRDLMEKGRDDMRGENCPGGVIQKELDRCLADIKKESCGNPLDTLARLAACRTGNICKSSP